MPTYSDEVNVYNPNAINDAIGEAATTATSVITEVGSTGIKIHPSGQSGNEIVDYTLIDADGMEVFDGGTSVAEFGASGARVGKQAGPRTVIQSTGVDMYGASDGSEQLAHFGYGDTWSSSSAQTTKPYYQIGKPLSEPSAWVSGTSYKVGDVVSYGGKRWVCKVENSSATSPPGYYWQLVNGSYSMSEGTQTIAGGENSHAEGYRTKALGEESHAEGSYSIAGLTCAHAEGYGTLANHYYSHAEGYHTEALGQKSHAGGDNTIAQHGQYAIGRWNEADDSGAPVYALIIGNGTEDARSNALAVRWDGSIECASDTGWITLNSTIKYRIHHGVCYVVGISTNVTQVATGGTVVGTLPTGAKPTIDVEGAATTMGNNCGQWKVGTNGQITVWGFGSATKYWAFTASYPL